LKFYAQIIFSSKFLKHPQSQSSHISFHDNKKRPTWKNVSIFIMHKYFSHFSFNNSFLSIQIYCSFGWYSKEGKILHEGIFDFYYNLIFFRSFSIFFPLHFIFFLFFISINEADLYYDSYRENFFITEGKEEKKDPSINFIFHFEAAEKKRKVSIKIWELPLTYSNIHKMLKEKQKRQRKAREKLANSSFEE